MDIWFEDRNNKTTLNKCDNNNNSDFMELSVIVLTYNHSEYIDRCLNSICSQTLFTEVEVIVGEDYSTDDTYEKVLVWREKFKNITVLRRDRNNKIKLFDFENGRSNFINCLQHSKGHYIAFCDGDDYWLESTKLEKQLKCIKENDYDYVFSHLEKNGFWRNADLIFEEKSKIIFSSMMINRRILKVFEYVQKIAPVGDLIFKTAITTDSYSFPSLVFYETKNLNSWTNRRSKKGKEFWAFYYKNSYIAFLILFYKTLKIRWLYMLLRTLKEQIQNKRY